MLVPFFMYGMPADETARIGVCESKIAGRTMRRARPKTLTLILGNGSVDVAVTWKPAMPSEVYEVTIADTLPANCTAAVLPGQTAAGATIRITASGGLGLALGTEVDLTAWT